MAFVLMADAVRIYFAGDLNHWHWAGESEAYNAQMAEDYAQEMKKLAGLQFDAAFIPVDPRLDAAFDKGVAGFLKCASADVIVPMHMWEEFDVVQRVGERFPRQRFLAVGCENQMFFLGEGKG